MTVKPELLPEKPGRGARLLALGGLIAALAASSFCILPVAMFSLGISGAWISTFTQLAPYKLFFVATALGCVGSGYWLMHRASKRACVGGQACARPLSNGIVKSVLVAATIIVVAAFAFDYIAPYFLS